MLEFLLCATSRMNVTCVTVMCPRREAYSLQPFMLDEVIASAREVISLHAVTQLLPCDATESRVTLWIKVESV